MCFQFSLVSLFLLTTAIKKINTLKLLEGFVVYVVKIWFKQMVLCFKIIIFYTVLILINQTKGKI